MEVKDLLNRGFNKLDLFTFFRADLIQSEVS